MKIYKYNPMTKEFTGAIEARLDPLETKKAGQKRYLTPGNGTKLKPPTVKVNEIACLEDGAWVIKKDFRGTTYWIGYKKTTIDEIDVTVPIIATQIDPGERPKTAQEIKQEKNEAVRQEMAAINLSSIELMRNFLVEKFGTDPLIVSLKEKEVEYNARKTEIL